MDERPEPPTEPYAKDVQKILAETEDLKDVIRKCPPARSESKEKDELLKRLEDAQIGLAKAARAARGEFND